jgi:zinc protease
MSHRTLVPIALFLSMVAAPVAGAQSSDTTSWPDTAFEPAAEIPFDPAVRTGTLDNGLRWFVRENSEPENRAALRLVVNAGSVLEDDDQRGLAHFLEHMAFNGTENFEKQELVDYLESIGMEFGPEINAYTSFDETVYMLQIPLDDPEIVDTAFTVLADWSRRLTLDPEEVRKERGVVLEEWRLGRGARQRVRDAQIPVLFHGARYAERLPIGLPEIIESADRERLQRFYDEWYRPDLMAVIAVGDFEAETMIEHVEESFGGGWGPSDPEERTVYEVPPHDDTKIVIATDEELSTNTVRVVVKKPFERVETVADFREALVEQLYTGMLNQRLRELTNEPDPPFVFGGVGKGRFARTAQSVSLYATAEDGGLERALEAILLEAKRVAEHGFTEAELERTKAGTLRSLRNRYDERENVDNGRYARQYVSRFLEDRNIPGIEWRYEAVQRLLPGIGVDEVNAVDLGAELLQRENRVITASAPDDPGVPVPTEADLLAVFERVETIPTEPYEEDVSEDPLLARTPEPGEVVSEERIEELDLTVWTLGNGHRVLVKPTDFKQDDFSFTAFSPGGRSQGTLDLDRSLDFASSFVGAGGVGDFDAIELGKKLAGKRASASAYISTYEEGLRGGGSPEDLETVLQLAWKRIHQPRRDDEAVTALEQRYAAMLRNRGADPQSQYSDSLSVILAQRHPWSTPLTAEAVESIDLGRAMDFYQERFDDLGDMTWVFVGSLDLDVLRDHVETYVASIRSDDDPDSWRDPGIDMPEGPLHRVIRAGVDDKARTTLVMHGDLEWTRRNRFALNTLGDVLGIRLRELIREELGGTYGVRVNASSSRIPEPEWTLRISFGSDPERLDELVGRIVDSLEDVRANGIDPERLEKVREQALRGHEESVQENSYWVSTLAFRERHGIDHREQLETVEFIESLTADQVDAVARWALPVERIIRVDMLPAEEGAGR